MKAGYTVEAALICPFLCLLLCVMISFTLSFYEKVDSFGKEAVEAVQKLSFRSDMLRMERLVCDWIE